jgi:hypothetical protein
MKETPETTKKPYLPPTLSKYGDLASLTKSASKTATMMDGGSNSIKSN